MQGYFGTKICLNSTEGFVNICLKFVKKLKKLVNEWCTIKGQSSTFLSSLPRTLHQQFESYKQEVRRIGAETRRQQTQQKDDAPTCGICRKTKFADGCGHLCSYCQTKFCARCGGRVSLRSNNVRNLPLSLSPFHTHLIPAAADVQLVLLLLCLLVSALLLPCHTLLRSKCVCNWKNGLAPVILNLRLQFCEMVINEIILAHWNMKTHQQQHACYPVSWLRYSHQACQTVTVLILSSNMP